ncbi:MAG: CheR family methyltransferase [Bacteroidota bacterium]|nr:CheR family methyltransferase [Bacteroidota bacterium]
MIKKETDNKNIASDFPVIGIGTSAGGLNALELFFRAIPENKKTGMAFIVVQHLDPDHKSILNDLIQQYTSMSVFMIEDGIKVKPDSVYIIPPNTEIAFFRGSIQITQTSNPRGFRLPIDSFFRSLAVELHEKAICIILSGTGTDGTLGIQSIKGEGGLTIAQLPESAAYDGMPRSAISTGMVDFILPPEKMPEHLQSYVKHIFTLNSSALTNDFNQDDNIINKIFLIIRNQTGHDFSKYKPKTINRRILRRMAINKIDKINDYILYLKSTPLEVETLFRELLIGVTGFFRDPQAFDSVNENLIPGLFKNKFPNSVIRIWIPACSTGEEAFSFAILLQEYMDKNKEYHIIQIFATDIDNESIEKARLGTFTENIASDISPERLSRFFIHENNSYRIHKTIRDMIVFAKQDIIKDPPFTKIDLISCRNLLIYFSNDLQKKIITLFHYSLNQNGFLFLGNSESIGTHNNIFTSIDKKWKIFQRKEMEGYYPYINSIQNTNVQFSTPGRISKHVNIGIKPNIKDLVVQFLLENHTPPCIIINADMDILFIHGHTGKYLEPATGDANMNLTRMVREELKMELIAAVRKVITQQITVRYNGIKFKHNNEILMVNLVVEPFKNNDQMHNPIIVIFEEVPSDLTFNISASTTITDKDQWISDLEKTLRTKDEYLNTTVEELETTNEELKSTNEELQSSNEELQSSNEELETSREELQSVNEELSTVNSELQKKIEELSYVNNDMNNLLASTGIGTIFIDHSLHIKRFTPAATQIINLIQTDINRPVSDIVSRLKNYPALTENIQKVLDTLIPIETKVLNIEGREYSMRIQPYRTIENVIEGAVLTFVEINKNVL